MFALRTPCPRARTARILRVVGLLAAAALSACASAARSENALSPVTTRLLVRNFSPEHVTLYLAGRGSKWRLGEIAGSGDVTLPVPRWALADIGEVYLVARPLAGRPFRSESFFLPRGGTAIWTIESHPAMSHVVLSR